MIEALLDFSISAMEFWKNKRLSDNSIKKSLIFFSIILYNPYKTNKYVKKINVVCFLFAMFIFAFATVILWFTEEHDLRFVAEFLWNLGLFALVTFKYIPLLIWEEKFINLIDSRKHFWKIDGFPKELDDEIYFLLKSLNILVQCFSVSVYSCVSMGWLLPFFRKDGLMSIGYYTKSTYKYLLMIQIYHAFMLSNLVIATTNFFLSITIDLIVQFRVMKFRIQQRVWSDQQDNLEEVARILKHYRFLENYMEDMKDVLLSPFFGLYFCTMITACVESYTLLETDAETVYNLKALTFLAAVFLQLGIYSIPTFELVSEIRDVSNAWYMSNWVDTTADYRKVVPFLIMQTQDIQDFKALGLVTINNLCLIDVIKAAMSFLTFMKSLK